MWGSVLAQVFYWGTYLWAVLWSKTRNLFRTGAIRGGDDTVSLDWVRSILPQSASATLVSATVKRGKIRSGLTGDMLQLNLEWSGADSESMPKSLVVKANMPSIRAIHSSIMLNSAREALWFATQSGLSASNGRGKVPRYANVPKVYDARGSWTTGEFAIVAEDLSDCTFPCQQLLGNQCWGAVNVPAGLETDPSVILGTIFNNIALLHGKHWRDFSLFEIPWLKAANWARGFGRPHWELAFSNFLRNSSIVLPPKGSTTSAQGVNWSPVLVRCVEQFRQHTSWGSYCQDLQDPSTIFTLVHGDFHAGNVLWTKRAGSSDPSKAAERPPFFLVDWSEVGIGNPFTELAQFVVSNLTIEARKKHERKLFDDYWKVLTTQGGVDGRKFTRELCWEHYKLGGAERWVQMLVLLAMFNVRTPQQFAVSFVQWFHDQVASFVEDHFPTCTLPPVLRSVYCIS